MSPSDDDPATSRAPGPYTLPMFPLGGVLFPYAVLPVHVFEPRYRMLVHECLTSTREFGIVLIERGFEVGGGDDRFGVGTVASIVRAAQSEDGRWGLITVGSRRIRVEEWLPDDPYPRATVTDLADSPATAGEEAGTLLSEAERLIRRALAFKAELDEPTGVPATFELAEDREIAAWQLAAYAPMGQVDQLRVLSEDDPTERLRLVVEYAGDAAAMLEFRLGSG